jgi:hypothetical protein
MALLDDPNKQIIDAAIFGAMISDETLTEDDMKLLTSWTERDDSTYTREQVLKLLSLLNLTVTLVDVK